MFLTYDFVLYRIQLFFLNVHFESYSYVADNQNSYANWATYDLSLLKSDWVHLWMLSFFCYVVL
jgi:hypothetical protein